ncbi:MAG: ParB/RepB/Spo0J family partition protein [Gorillibacterium sp.]|nr:ParB/RepB/Spo0J family partition protein [Gorillibacterium sp.]
MQQEIPKVLTHAFLPIHLVDQNPQQPRILMDEKHLAALAASIAEIGVLEPILVHKHEHQRFMLIAGHQRLAAAEMAGLKSIPARILPAHMINILAAAVTENMLRQDLDVIEIARALDKLAGMGADRNNLCVFSGMSKSSVSELIRINRIPWEVLEDCLRTGKTKKRFLIQLSRCGDADEIKNAYCFYCEFGQLPSREKREYAPTKKMLKPLALLRELNVSLNETVCIDYLGESDLDDKFRNEMVALIKSIKKRGWFIPNIFDASN